MRTGRGHRPIDASPGSYLGMDRFVEGIKSSAAILEARIKVCRREGCVTRLDAVPLRTSLKQGKRQKPVPQHLPALTLSED